MDSGNNGSVHVLPMATGKGLLVNIVNYLATACLNDDEGYQLQGWLVVVGLTPGLTTTVFGTS